jgi:hypothetical protein
VQSIAQWCRAHRHSPVIEQHAKLSQKMREHGLPGGGTTGNNMVLVTEYQYDGGLSGGDGNRTRATAYVDDATTRVTHYTYDWRNRLLTTDGEENFFQSRTYDNLGRVTRVERRDTTSTGMLVARTDTFYDDLDRVYSTVLYGVDLTSGATTGSLAGNTWYAAAGNVIKQQQPGQRTFTKTVYDGAGRRVAAYTGYDLAETSYTDAASIADDTILEQVQTAYDEAGGAILFTTRRRLPTADATLGSLGNATTQPLARVSYQAVWYDGAGRAAATANVTVKESPSPISAPIPLPGQVASHDKQGR